MSSKTKIEWAEASWNPVIGCSKVSEGCQNCYAERMAMRLWYMGNPVYGRVTNENGKWNNQIICLGRDVLDKPLHWRKPRIIFVCSMSDLFHEKVPFDYRDKVIAVFEKCPQHTGIILTKREDELLRYAKYRGFKWPANIIGMVTVENQKWAEIRIPKLLQCGFARTGVSCEPLLGPIDFRSLIIGPRRRGSYDCLCGQAACEEGTMKDPISGHLDWIIVGGESGPKARPMDIKWARSIKDQCQAAGVPFFMKQLGGCPNKRDKMSDFPEDLKIREYPKGIE